MAFLKGLSLKGKTMLTMILIISVISIVSLILFSRATQSIIRSEYSTYCTDLASTVASSVNVSDVKGLKRATMKIYRSLPESAIKYSDQEEEDGYSDYLSNYSSIEQTKEYTSLRNALRKMQDVSHVECLYITWPDLATGRLIYLVDGAYVDNWQPGTLEPLYDSDFKTDGDISSGFDILSGTDDEGGHIVTAAMPICDSYGQIIAYAGLDYCIDDIIIQQRRFTMGVILIIAFLAVLASYISIKLVDRSIVKPINSLSAAAAEYYREAGSSEGPFHRFADLDIHTGDEIETLAGSIAKMESDMNDHIANLLSTRNELSSTKEFAEKMEEDAFKDPLTSVRNKRALDAAITNLRADITQNVAKFGIAVIDLNDLKLINDTYGHDRGDDAIRKICSIICEVFRHSPVYRFGGDEFVVLLRNRDLENVRDLIASFRAETEALQNDPDTQPWERVSAAFGYAVFDPESDRDTESVFERADKAMYMDKRKTKQAAAAGKRGSAINE